MEGRKVQTVAKFIFLGFKITADDDCSHETKKQLLLGRRGMTYLGSILKSRDITLPTEVHIVKAMVFPVVIYRCESWIIKKAERWRIDAFKLCRRLESPLDSMEIKPAILKDINLEYSLEGLMLKFQYFGHLMQRPNSWEKTLMLGKIEGTRRRGRQRMRLLDSITDSMDMNLSKLRDNGQGSLECCSPWSLKDLNMI